MNQYCILQMATSDTLNLVQQLNRRGFDAWTPVERITGKKPRTRKVFDITKPLMGGYAFAPARHQADLLRLMNAPLRDFPKFRFFQHEGAIPLISEGSLDALKAEEARISAVYEKRRASMWKGPKRPVGAAVAVSSGGFEGLSGTVAGHQGNFTRILFDGFSQPVAVASALVEG